MEQQPADVNLGKLQKFLDKSKMVMEATKVPVPGKGGQANATTQSSYDGMAEKPLPDMNHMLSERGIKTNVDVPQYDENLMYSDAVENSRLPPHLKKLMKEQRIEQPTHVGANVSESAMAAMNRETKGKAAPQLNERIQSQPTPQTTSAPGFTREEMKGMIKECLSEMMMESITETAIKGTLKKMMTEGKLRVKK